MPPTVFIFARRAVTGAISHTCFSGTQPRLHPRHTGSLSAIPRPTRSTLPRSSIPRSTGYVARSAQRSLRHLSSSTSTAVPSTAAAHIAQLNHPAPSAASTAFTQPSSSSRSHRQHEDEHRTNDDSSSSSSSSSSTSSAWSVWSLFAPFQRAFHWYLDQLNARPYTVQMLTSAFLFAIGDITAQHYEAHLDTQKLLATKQQHHTPPHPISDDHPVHPLHHHSLPLESHPAPAPFSLHRLAACTMFGLLVMGPAGHWWYSRLDGWVLRWAAPRTMRFVGYKVLLDTVIFNPLFLIIFFTSVSLMEGMSSSDIRFKLYRDFVPSYAVDCSVWPIVQCFNFRFVSVNLQLLVVNLFCYFDDVFISYVQHNGMPALFVGIENAWLDYIGVARKSESSDSSDGRITEGGQA